MSRCHSGSRPSRPAVLVVVAVVAAVVVGVLGVGVASVAVNGAGIADAPVAAAGEPAVASAVDSPVDPTVSAPASVNRSEPLRAVVSLPESADAERSFRVQLAAASGVAVSERTVTLAPGESTTVDFGRCRPPAAYGVRVASMDGDVLVANQTAIVRPDEPVTIEDWNGHGEATVRDDGTLRLDATYHGCVDEATFSLTDDETEVWSATVVDADDDGSVTLEWDVDAPAGSGLGVGDGDALANASQPDGPVPLGTYRLEVSGDVRIPTSGTVTVAFAAPEVRAFVLDRTHSASSAIDAVQAGDAAAGNGHAERTVAAGEQWVVVRIDTDGTVDSLPADTSLLYPSRHENATVRVRGAVGPGQDPDSDLDLANATRRFDARTDTVYYAFRADADTDTSHVAFVALGDDGVASGVPNATDGVRLAFQDAVTFEFDGPPVVAPAANESVRGYSAFADGTELIVSVRRDGSVLATDEVVVVDDGIESTFDLSDVPNGTNATLVVERNGHVVAETPVEVAARPIPLLRGAHLTDEPVAGEPATVRVYVSNVGTSALTDVVRVTIGNRTRTRTVTLAPDERRELAVEFESIPDRSMANVSVSFGGETDRRSIEIADPTDVETTTWTDPLTTGSGTTPTTDAATSWPTLVGSERRSESSPVPGFGVVVAVAAVLASAVVVARRRGRDRRGRNRR